MKEALFTLNNPYSPRIDPDLAKEIGLNESIMLLQIEFWIRTSTTEKYEGREWTYQSVRNIQKTFKFWSVATINRIINKLVDAGYIVVGNFNKKNYDRTRWFSLNYDKLQELKSIKINKVECNDEEACIKMIQGVSECNRVFQDETTIPETTTETTTKDMHAPQTLFDESEEGGTKKDNNTCVYTPAFEEFWKVYPRKQEKKAAFMKWKACLRKGIDPNILITAAKNYAEYVRQNGTTEQFIKHATTFLGPSEVYLEWANRKPEPDSYPYGTAEETRRRLGWD